MILNIERKASKASRGIMKPLKPSTKIDNRQVGIGFKGFTPLRVQTH